MDSPPPSYDEATGPLALNSYLKSVLSTDSLPRYDEITTTEPVTLPILPQPISPNIQTRPQPNILLHREENEECDEKWSWYLVILVIIGLGILFFFLPNTSFHA